MKSLKKVGALRRSFLYLIVISIVCFFVYSCKKSLNDDAVKSADVLQAKAWYNNAYPKTSIGNASLNLQANDSHSLPPDMSQFLNPDWEHSTSYERLGKKVIEIPIDAGAKFNFGLKNKLRLFNKAYSRTSFLILKDTSGYKAFVMMVIADSAYVKNDFTKLAHNTYRSYDSDFSGVVLYFTPKGKFVRSYGYKDGKLIPPQNTTALTSNQQTQSLKTNSNQTPYTLECYDWFMDYYTNGNFDYEVYLYTTCEVVGTGSGNGGPIGDGPSDGGGTSSAPPCPTGTNATNAVGKIGTYSHQDPPSDSPDPGGNPGFPDPTKTSNPCVTSVTDSESDLAADDPCSEKVKLNKNLADPNIADIITEIKKHLSSGKEYGAAQALKDWKNPSLGYASQKVTTNNSSDEFSMSFTWNSTDGYQTGIIHDHPGGSAPSPDDIFKIFINLTSSQLVTAGNDAIQYYKKNANVTVVTSDNIYVLTIHNWAQIAALKAEYDKDKTAFYAEIEKNSDLFQNYEAALLSKFGSSVNLYTSPLVGLDFTPIIVAKDTSEKVIVKEYPCKD